MVRIAVCTRNGIAVDEHFGRTDCFYIYDVGKNTIGLAGMRLTRKYCDGYRAHELNEPALNGIYALLNDCEFLFTEMIGEEPRNWLERKNITIITGHVGVPKLINVVKTLKKKEVTHA